MGTSSIYDGPMDNNPLLPDNIDELINKDETNEEVPVQNIVNPKYWQSAKTSMSKYASGTSGDYKGAVKKYIRASGGSSKLAENSIAGKNSFVRLGQVLSSIREHGITDTFRSLKIDTIGKNIEVLFSELVNAISFESDTKDESVAKEATIDALMIIYEYLEENNLGIDSLEELDDVLYDTVLCDFITCYIWGKILSDLEKSFEKNSKNIETTLHKEADIKEYIRNMVDVELAKNAVNVSIDFESNIQEIVNDLYIDIYKSLEGVII